MAERWYVDSSVILRIIKDGSPSARDWFDAALAAGDTFLASRLMKVEVLRVLKNNALDPTSAQNLISRFILLSLDDDLAEEAIALVPLLGGADSLHIASALRVGPTQVTVVTHDAQMASAATALGFAVLDPVIDDPHSPAIA